MRNDAVDQSLNFRHWQIQIDGWKNILLWSKMYISQSWSGSTLLVMFFFFLVFEKIKTLKHSFFGVVLQVLQNVLF